MRTFNQILPTIKKNFSYSMEDIIQGVLKDDSLLTTLFEERLIECNNDYTWLKQNKLQQYLSKKSDAETIFKWKYILEEKIKIPSSLSNQELFLLFSITDRYEDLTLENYKRNDKSIANKCFLEIQRRIDTNEDLFSATNLFLILGLLNERSGRKVEAIELYKRAVELGCTKAFYKIAQCHLTEKNFNDYNYFLRRAICAADANALYYAANIFVQGFYGYNNIYFDLRHGALDLYLIDRSSRLEEAKKFFFGAIDGGLTLDSLSCLSNLYSLQHEIKNATKCTVVYLQNNTIQAKEDNVHFPSMDTNNSYVTYYQYHYDFETDFFKSNKPRLKHDFLLPFLNNTWESIDDLKNLILEEDWGKYNFIFCENNIDETELIPFTIYLYPIENKKYLFGYMIKDHKNNLFKEILEVNDYPDLVHFFLAVENKSIAKLSAHHKESLLQIIAQHGLIPRERILPLLDSSIVEQVHKQKLSSIPLIEYYLKKLTHECGIAEKITSFAININSAERELTRKGVYNFNNALTFYSKKRLVVDSASKPVSQGFIKPSC